MDSFLDIVGQILWFSIFLTPVITIPLACKYSKTGKLYRIILGLLMAFFLSIIFYSISMAILLRDGLGPT